MSQRYRNLDPSHRTASFGAVFRWALWDRLTGRRRVSPPGPPAAEVDGPVAPLEPTSAPGARLQWLGHCGYLLGLAGRRFAFDPVLSRRIGGFYPRFGAPPCARLPPLDALLISHNHYDHLDAPTCRQLARSTPVVVPRGLGQWFARRGFELITELGWWEQTTIGEVTVTFVPARHWSRRSPIDTNRSWWGGYLLEAGPERFYFAGDSAWFDGFEEIGRRFPGALAAVLPIGGYEPAWFMSSNHMNPEEAGRAFLASKARALIPMHWGAFQLTDEPLAAPAAWLREWWKREGPTDGRRLLVPAVGEIVEL